MGFLASGTIQVLRTSLTGLGPKEKTLGNFPKHLNRLPV
jgi:hypothetical protein